MRSRNGGEREGRRQNEREKKKGKPDHFRICYKT